MRGNIVSREVHLVRRPHKMPALDNFAVATVNIAPPGTGEVLARNSWMSVDPYMRNRMNAGPGYAPSESMPGLPGYYVGAFELNQPMLGGAIGEVVASNSPEFAVGDIVESMLGWREYALGPPSAFRKIDPLPGVPLSAYLGTLGMTGLTAYAGLFAIGSLRHSEALFVTSAAGAVGTLACQLAKAHGCYVVGTAGSVEKCNWLEEVVGIDRAINYRTCDDLAGALASAFPTGINLHLANVGGAQLDAALLNMANFGRIAISGFIESYNEGAASPVLNLFMAVRRSLRVQGYTQLDHEHLIPKLHAEVGGLIRDGRLSIRETVAEGIENAAQAFLDLFGGTSQGKMVVRLNQQAEI